MTEHSTWTYRQQTEEEGPCPVMRKFKIEILQDRRSGLKKKWYYGKLDWSHYWYFTDLIFLLLNFYTQNYKAYGDSPLWLIELVDSEWQEEVSDSVTDTLNCWQREREREREIWAWQIADTPSFETARPVIRLLLLKMIICEAIKKQRESCCSYMKEVFVDNLNKYPNLNN